MEKSMKGSLNPKLTCEICKIDFTTNADYALHEFSKKHCDNLIRIAKHKPVVNKQKAKIETPPVEKEPPKVNTVTHAGSFAKYGYFVLGEIYRSAEVAKEFNTDYDPYLQKFAENPFKVKSETPQGSIINGSETSPAIQTCSLSFSSRKKKKKVKTCQICNVTLQTVPEYKAHMKSPKHIWELKVTGMGVSAHFVKASTDLHTTDITEECKSTNQTKMSQDQSVNENLSSEPFPLLYCQDCELLLNSPQQYNAHVAGKSHISCAQRKAELKAKKEKLLNPSSNQLYCYSCQISLNNLFQYNEHKNGKKHKSKCKQLIKKGITIPPEERVSGLAIPKFNSNKSAVYPELYEKLILDKQKQEKLTSPVEPPPEKINVNNAGQESVEVPNILSGVYHCGSCNLKFGTLSKYSNHLKSREHCQIFPGLSIVESKNKSDETQRSNLNMETSENEHTVEGGVFNKPSIIFHSKSLAPDKQFTDSDKSFDLLTTTPKICLSDIATQLPTETVTLKTNDVNEYKKENNQVTLITDNAPLKCNICLQDFNWQSQFDMHLNSEDHMKKILELKSNKSTDAEILKIIFSDRSFVKPDNLGKLSCSICNVTTETGDEFEQHLKSIVHKYTEKDYRRKRTAEVKHIVAVDEHGLYFCKLCKEGWSSLIDFIHHLHLVKHGSIQSAERARKILAKRRSLMLQKQRRTQSLKRKKLLARRRLKGEKNPGVRTKICGVATDLHTGARAPIPNLEPLEPKIDPTKNVNLGVNRGKSNSEKFSSVDKSAKIPKHRGMSTANRKMRPQNFSCKEIPPLIPPLGATIPPLLPGPPFQPPPFLGHPPPPPPYFMLNRPWSPYPRPGRPVMGNPYPGSPWLQRTRSPFGNR